MATSLDDFLSTQQVVILPITTLSAMFFTYGFYVLLFGTCLSIQMSQKNTNRKLYTGFTISLFVIATLSNAFQAMGFVRQADVYFSGVKTLNYEPVAQYFANDRWKIVAQSFQNFTSIFANLVADLMLIHRCYIVWNSRKEVALPLLFLSFGTNVVGLAGSILESLGLQDSTNDANFALYEKGAEVLAGYSITATVISSLLTLLTAGRIWYITHEARSMMGGQVRKRYNTLIAVILESGIIYPTLMIIHLVLSNTTMDINGYGSVVLYPVVTQVAGIAPTLIIVRVGLGKSVEPVYGDGEGGPSAVSTLRFAESGLCSTGMAQRASFK